MVTQEKIEALGPGHEYMDSVDIAELVMLSSKLKMLENVPSKVRQSWAALQTDIVDKLKRAKSQVEKNRYYKWFLALPVLFLRKPRSRGRKNRRVDSGDTLQSRFDH